MLGVRSRYNTAHDNVIHSMQGTRRRRNSKGTLPSYSESDTEIENIQRDRKIEG